MWLFLFVETMLFAGMFSASTIVRAGTTIGWEMPNTFELGSTMRYFNMYLLLTSGFFAQKAWRRRDNQKELSTQLKWTLALGIAFVVLQGSEWAALLHEGFTITSSGRGGFFYLMVGAHAAHAVVAIIALLASANIFSKEKEIADFVDVALILWGFVVVLWPIIFFTVYR